VVATSTDLYTISRCFGGDGWNSIDDGLGLGGGLFCEVDGAGCEWRERRLGRRAIPLRPDAERADRARIGRVGQGHAGGEAALAALIPHVLDTSWHLRLHGAGGAGVHPGGGNPFGSPGPGA